MRRSDQKGQNSNVSGQECLEGKEVEGASKIYLNKSRRKEKNGGEGKEKVGVAGFFRKGK